VRVNRLAHVVHDHVAGSGEQRPDLVPIAAVVRCLVMSAQAHLGAPSAEQDILGRRAIRKHSIVNAVGLGQRPAYQFGEYAPQLVRETRPPV